MLQTVPAKLTYQMHRALGYAGVKAAENAERLVEPEHLLFGLLQDEHAEAWRVLNELHYDPLAIRRAVAALLDRQSPSLGDAAVPASESGVCLSDATKRVLQQAAIICAQQRQRHVGPRHVLLALQKMPGERLATIWKTHHLNITDDAPTFGMTLESKPNVEQTWHEREYPAPVFSQERGEWSRFTAKAQQVIYFAQNEALNMGHNQVSPLYLLAGLLRCERTIAEDVLRNCGMDRVRLCEEIIDLLDAGEYSPGRVADIKLDTETVKVLEKVGASRVQLEDRHVGTEHILLGLLTDKGAAGNFLRQHGLTTATALAKLRGIERSTTTRKKPSDYLVTKIAWVILALSILGLLFLLLVQFIQL